MSDTATSDEEFWNTRYAQTDCVWSGNPNAVLVRETAGLTPGTALDLGCGEGADAIHLARQGWRVTAADISRVALDRAAEGARAEGVADRVDWQQRDLAESFPAGEFDLVSAQFLHFRDEASGARVLRAAASAVAPGGLLLIEGHAGFPAWEHNHVAAVHFPTPQETVAVLDLQHGRWDMLLSEEHERVQAAPDGRPTTRTDLTVKLRRLPV